MILSAVRAQWEAATRPRLARRLAAFSAGAALLALILSWDTIRARSLDVPDRAAFESFLDENGQRATYARFAAYLEARGVSHVVPAWQLWRQGVEWRALGIAPFAIPPEESWGHIVPALAAVRDLVIPVTGAVEVVSGFRTPAYNQRAGGAHESRHLAFDAVDLVPSGFATRFTLKPRLLRMWQQRGEARHLGLGLYVGTRFHVDTHRYRRW